MPENLKQDFRFGNHIYGSNILRNRRWILQQYVKYGTEINARTKWVLRLQQRFMC